MRTGPRTSSAGAAAVAALVIVAALGLGAGSAAASPAAPAAPTCPEPGEPIPALLAKLCPVAGGTSKAVGSVAGGAGGAVRSTTESAGKAVGDTASAAGKAERETSSTATRAATPRRSAGSSSSGASGSPRTSGTAASPAAGLESAAAARPAPTAPAAPAAPQAPTQDYGALFSSAFDQMPASFLSGASAPGGAAASLVGAGRYDPGLLLSSTGPVRSLAPADAGSGVTTATRASAVEIGSEGRVGTPVLLSVLAVASLLALAVRSAVLRRSRRPVGV